jgi:hypothetical protein
VLGGGGVPRIFVSLLVLATLAPAAASAQVRVPTPPRGSRARLAAPRTDPAGAAIAPFDLLWPESPPATEWTVHRPRLRRGRDDGLLVTGAILLAVSYGGGIVAGMFEQANDDGCSTPSFSQTNCDSWPFAFVPIFGPLLAGTVAVSGRRSDYVIGGLAGPVVAAGEIAGLVVLLLGALGETVDVVPAPPRPGLDLTVVPYASASGAGLAIEVRL